MSNSETKHNLDSRFWKIVFIVAGLYTTGGVLPGILNPQQGLFDFTGQNIDDFYTRYFFQSGWITVFVFGIGYFIVATKPSKYIGIVIIGLLGKLLFASNILLQMSSEKFSSMSTVAGLIDLIFVILFGYFIYTQQIQKFEVITSG